ncbi:MAG: YdeI/OmpD-associated family protein [Bryocella sp.]
MAPAKASSTRSKKSLRGSRPPTLAQSFLPAVDVYIATAQPFAQPILEHLRDAVHKAVPEVVEEMKWRMPFFLYKGIILANIAGFKAHCSLGVWKENVLPLMKPSANRSATGMGSFGKMSSMDDLPKRKELAVLLAEAARKIDSGERKSSMPRPKKSARPKPVIPTTLAVAFKKNKLAAKNFDAMTASAQREYVDWINEAKREETRATRVATTIEWVAEGKSRSWKYEKRG